MTSALAYIRKSSAPGNGSVSFDMEVRATRDLATRHGDELPEILSDMAVSGGSTTPARVRSAGGGDRGRPSPDGLGLALDNVTRVKN